MHFILYVCRHCGQRLSGELVSIQAENFELIDLPDLRSSELYFVASCAEYNSEYRSDISFNKYTVSFFFFIFIKFLLFFSNKSEFKDIANFIYRKFVYLNLFIS